MARVVFYRERHGDGPSWLCCEDLIEVLQTRRIEEVLAILAAAERAAEKGLYAAGFLAYEAAPAMDDACAVHPAGTLPLAWFGLFRRMVPCGDLADPPPGEQLSGEWRASVSAGEYQRAIERIKHYIARGETYQVNYTFRLRTPFSGDAWPLFVRLCRAQRTRYGAYFEAGNHVICSASPELFFRLEGERLISRPMKGTVRRGMTLAGDRLLRAALADSEKDRAENAMIVDMMRNDIGRIARRGSVRVTSAFDVEQYPTVFQMTSTVTAETTAPFAQIMRALFPAASITGAPKIRTMQIIRELEPEARGVYTGCIGYLAPGRRARFNVAIRTVSVDRTAGQAEYGVGGGIVWDSATALEYAECRVKAALLTAESPRFELLETMLHEADRGWFLLEGHLKRLSESAKFFDFALDLDAVRKRLDELAGHLTGDYRVRLLVGRRGECRTEYRALAAPGPDVPPPAVNSPNTLVPRQSGRGSEVLAPWRLQLAAAPVDSHDVFLYHKTTHRRTYESLSAGRGECDDVVLWNAQGEITETTIANLVLRKDGRLVTPPVACGLLAGVYREHLLETGRIEEGVLTVDDLRQAPALFAVNSVRRWMSCVMVGESK
jgi:para-aminobenzoate synthetase/4-amino-4-deoxychorismate lyase